MEIGYIRSALFVPGNRPDRVLKAINTSADAVIIDLEDSVPVEQKDAARKVIRENTKQHPDRLIFARVNATDSELINSDLSAIVNESLAGIIIPKIADPAQLGVVNELLLESEKVNAVKPGKVIIIPMIESALGVENAFKIASCPTEPNRVYTLTFGAADLTLDLGVRLSKSGEELAYPRARLAVACRAACLAQPLDTPFMIDLKDRQALENDIQRAGRLGFQGKLCIHPNQVDACNTLFFPSRREVEFARRVVQAFDDARAQGTAVIQLEGKFIDAPIVARARSILKIAEV